jgi:transposase
MTEIKTGGRRPPKYDEQYRKDAVELWRASGKTALEIGRELGIKPERLYQWAGSQRPPGVAAPQTPKELERENATLREEIERLREQRDILKKSLGILCEPPPRSMPKSKP